MSSFKATASGVATWAPISPASPDQVTLVGTVALEGSLPCGPATAVMSLKSTSSVVSRGKDLVDNGDTAHPPFRFLQGMAAVALR